MRFLMTNATGDPDDVPYPPALSSRARGRTARGRGRPSRTSDAAAVWQEVGRLLQTSDAFASGYRRYNLPRRDLTLRVGDVTVAPALALGARAGFSGDANDATMMVTSSATPRPVVAPTPRPLSRPKVEPMVSALATHGITATAVHSHR